MILHFLLSLLLRFLHVGITFLCSISGRTMEEMKYALCILSAYPLSHLYSLIKQRHLKHLISITISSIYCYICFDMLSLIHITSLAMFAYCVALYSPTKYHPEWIVFTVSMFQLSALHIYRMWNNYMLWTIEVTGVIMLTVIKVTSFTFNVVDKRKEGSQPAQPEVLEWLGYIYFFPSFLTGPTIEFEDYRDLTYNENQPNKNISSYSTLKSALLFVPLLFAQSYFDVNYLVSDEFTHRSLKFKFMFCYLVMLVIRSKYYFAWLISEANCLASGLNAEQAENVKIIKVETGQSPHQVLSSWNICTAKWLKKYVYQRLTEKHHFQRYIATFCTNLVSAFWHGFYPGYYLTFISGGIATEVAKKVRHNIRPLFTYNAVLKLLYDICCFFVTMTLITYSGLPFQLYGLKLSLLAWKNTYFIGHIILAIGLGTSIIAGKLVRVKTN